MLPTLRWYSVSGGESLLEGAKISLYSAGEESSFYAQYKSRKFITQVILQNIEVEDIDLSNATDLRSAWVQNNPALQKLD